MQSGYTKLRELGRGAFGVVDLVRRKKDGRLFAAKSLSIDAHASQMSRDTHTATSSSAAAAAADLAAVRSAARNKILDEVRVLQRLPQHPCIVGLEEVVESRDTVTLVLEYVGGGTLAERVYAHGEPSLHHCRNAAAAAADANHSECGGSDYDDGADGADDSARFSFAPANEESDVDAVSSYARGVAGGVAGNNNNNNVAVADSGLQSPIDGFDATGSMAEQLLGSLDRHGFRAQFGAVAGGSPADVAASECDDVDGVGVGGGGGGGDGCDFGGTNQTTGSDADLAAAPPALPEHHPPVGDADEQRAQLPPRTRHRAPRHQAAERAARARRRVH